jgi:hypothetical protein
MAAVVYLRLRDGRRVRFGHSQHIAGAARMKSTIEQWIADGITLTLADAHGGLRDVPPESVAGVDLDDEETPAHGVASSR